MPKFIPYDYNQNTMVVINLQDQIQPGTFEHAIYALVENNIDLSVYFPEETKKRNENHKIFFEGKLTDCLHCKSKHRCMRNPDSAETREGHGRQVSFIVGKKISSQFTDWMKPRVDSAEGKLIYSHRMSVETVLYYP